MLLLILFDWQAPDGGRPGGTNFRDRQQNHALSSFMGAIDGGTTPASLDTFIPMTA
jgi:hypothetical protein